MRRVPDVRNERGIALVTVLLIGFAVSAIALAGAMWMLNSQIIQKNNDRAALINDAAVAGTEEGRMMLSSNPALYPTTGYATLENGAQVKDAAGVVIPNLYRWTYAGPDGITSGQYGVYGTIISVVKDTAGGNMVVRREQINQESFAKYAYFTTIEGNIVFANNDQIRGPVHSNDLIKIASSGATFFDQVSTAQSSIQGQSNGTFNVPPKLSVPPIALPTTQAFTALQTHAGNAGMAFAGNTLGNSSGEASIRLEFVAIDLNADGDSTDANEGFVKIYQDNARPWYVTAQLSGNPGPNGDIRRTPNCGVPVDGGVITPNPNPASATARFRTAADTNPAGARNAQASNLLGAAGFPSRCFLGGDPRLTQTTWNNKVQFDLNAWNAVVGAAPRPTTTVAAGGTAGWIQRPAGIGAPVVAAFTNRRDAAFLWPINRTYNPSWEGVIYVGGRVAISGVVNGRVTIASPENVILADDLRTAVDPGSAAAADCGNIVGLFSGDSVVVADNTLNSPQRINGANPYRTYDETTEEDIHAVVLALDIFGAERYDQGATDAEDCNGTNNGRGCLALNGGIIQNTRGAVGLTDGHGYTKRYAYNSCAASDPPPYYPTTGHFSRNRMYELDPRNFNVSAWFSANQNN
ncbi:MAG TPA: hypothetical protein VH763_17475 [Gemmatimonadales bacterium]|jgi:hypothetical protein